MKKFNNLFINTKKNINNYNNIKSYCILFNNIYNNEKLRRFYILEKYLN